MCHLDRQIINVTRGQHRSPDQQSPEYIIYSKIKKKIYIALKDP